jgi:hypothetical protein
MWRLKSKVHAALDKNLELALHDWRCFETSRDLWLMLRSIGSAWRESREEPHFDTGFNPVMDELRRDRDGRGYGLENAQLEPVWFEDDNGRSSDERLEDAEPVA